MPDGYILYLDAHAPHDTIISRQAAHVDAVLRSALAEAPI